MAKHARPTWWGRIAARLKDTRLRGILLVVFFAVLFVVSYNYFTYQQGFRITDESELETPGQPGYGQEPGSTTDDGILTTGQGEKTSTEDGSANQSETVVDEQASESVSAEPDAATVLADMVAPVDGPILQNTGWYFSEVLQEWRYHPGVDIEASMETTVHAALQGIVDRVEYTDGYGSTVVIQHAAGVQTIYGGLGQVAVKAGDEVAAAQTIATIGDAPVAEESTPHLHFEVLVAGEPASLSTYVAK